MVTFPNINSVHTCNQFTVVPYKFEFSNFGRRSARQAGSAPVFVLLENAVQLEVTDLSLTFVNLNRDRLI